MSHRITVAEESRTDVGLFASRRKVVVLSTTTGNIATGAGALRWYNDLGTDVTIVSTRAALGTAPTGSSAIFDIKVNGTSIWATTTANRITVAASANTAQGGTPDTVTIPAGGYVTVDVAQIGSTVTGANVVVTMVVHPSVR